MAGQRVCAAHGGKTPGALDNADRRIETARQEKALERELARLGDANLVETDPLTAIMKAVSVASFVVEYLRLRVSELGDDDIAGERPHALLDLLRLWTKEQARAAKAALDVGVKEQQLRIFSQQVQLLADMIRKLFDDPELGLSPQQREAANHAMGRHLRSLDDVA